jgi:hypothetical protein
MMTRSVLATALCAALTALAQPAFARERSAGALEAREAASPTYELRLAQGSPPPLSDRKPAKPKVLPVPPPEVILMLLRTTLVALNQANFTGNYTVLHGLASPALQAKHSAADLGAVFTELRKLNTDLSPVLVKSPELTEAPVMTPEGALRLVGYFPTRPLETKFVMQFVPVDNRWRLDGLSVTTARAPEPAAAATDDPAKNAEAKKDAPAGNKDNSAAPKNDQKASEPKVATEKKLEPASAKSSGTPAPENRRRKQRGQRSLIRGATGGAAPHSPSLRRPRV